MDEFMKLVMKMRELQKEYFKNRSPQRLTKAKEYEKKVDKFIHDYHNPKIL